MIPEEASDEQVQSLVDACPQADLSAEYVSWEAKLARLMNAAEQVVKEAESVHYMGRMECSVEAIHGLAAALRALRNDGPGAAGTMGE